MKRATCHSTEWEGRRGKEKCCRNVSACNVSIPRGGATFKFRTLAPLVLAPLADGALPAKQPSPSRPIQSGVGGPRHTGVRAPAVGQRGVFHCMLISAVRLGGAAARAPAGPGPIRRK